MNFQSMTLFRNGKRPLDPRWVDYLEAIDYAISTVAVPVIERVVIEPPAPPPVPPLPAVALPEPVGNGLFADAPDNNVTRIRVMTIDDITAEFTAGIDIANRQRH